MVSAQDGAAQGEKWAGAADSARQWLTAQVYYYIIILLHYYIITF